MLGNDLLSRLSSEHEVVGMDKEEIDIVSVGECKKAVTEVKPDIVINAAAYTNVDGCETARNECFAVNAEAVKNIADACRDAKIKIVHFSTDYVFDGTAQEPYREDDPCNPINVYGESKLAGEKYLQALSDNYLLIRTSWLYGLKGKNFVQAILEKAKAKTYIADTMRLSWKKLKQRRILPTRWKKQMPNRRSLRCSKSLTTRPVRRHTAKIWPRPWRCSSRKTRREFIM